VIQATCAGMVLLLQLVRAQQLLIGDGSGWPW
jgi:hypothetical protein